MGIFNRQKPRYSPPNGNRAIAQLESGDDDGWRAEPKSGPSGVWVVMKMSNGTRENGWGNFNECQIMQAETGVLAIKNLYDKLHRDAKPDEKNQASGLYVALDFYGGERVEAKVTAEWAVDLFLVPQKLGR